MADATFVAWVDAVHALGGVATVWPFQNGAYGAQYGTPAGRFPAAVFADLSDAGQLPMADGVQFNVPGTWVYVLATAMTGTTAVNQAADTLTAPTKAEAEQACAVNGNCPTDFQTLVKEVVVGIAILAGVVVVSKLPKLG